MKKFFQKKPKNIFFLIFEILETCNILIDFDPFVS